MDNSKVMYMGRMVSKEGFRAFVYGKDNRQKIAESWDEYTKLLATGDWYASVEAMEHHEKLAQEHESKKIEHEKHELHEHTHKKASK